MSLALSASGGHRQAAIEDPGSRWPSSCCSSSGIQRHRPFFHFQEAERSADWQRPRSSYPNLANPVKSSPVVRKASLRHSRRSSFSFSFAWGTLGAGPSPISDFGHIIAVLFDVFLVFNEF